MCNTHINENKTHKIGYSVSTGLHLGGGAHMDYHMTLQAVSKID